MGFHSVTRPPTAPALAPAPATSLLGAPAPPPPVGQTTSQATIAARQAAEKQRRRASLGAGGTLLTGGPRTSPGAALQPKTLLGY